MVRLFLGLQALLFLAFSIFAILQPETLANTLGASGVGADGLYEFRSNYGGVNLGIGLLCLMGTFRESLSRPALYCLLAFTGGYALGRIIGLPLADGMPANRFLGFGVYEGVTALLSFALLFRAKS